MFEKWTFSWGPDWFSSRDADSTQSIWLAGPVWCGKKQGDTVATPASGKKTDRVLVFRSPSQSMVSGMWCGEWWWWL